MTIPTKKLLNPLFTSLRKSGLSHKADEIGHGFGQIESDQPFCLMPLWAPVRWKTLISIKSH